MWWIHSAVRPPSFLPHRLLLPTPGAATQRGQTVAVALARNIMTDLACSERALDQLEMSVWRAIVTVITGNL